MDTTVALISAALGGLATAALTAKLITGQRKKVARVGELLREQGGMTLDEIALELETSVFAKGYLMQALDQMVVEGELEKEPPPKGHPRLRVLRDTTYSLAEGKASKAKAARKKRKKSSPSGEKGQRKKKARGDSS